MKPGIVYVLVNEAFDSYVKIGKTINLEQRLKQLDNTSVPLPFRCVLQLKCQTWIRLRDWHTQHSPITGSEQTESFLRLISNGLFQHCK